MKKGKTIPLGYRDVELEERILLNTYKKKGIKEGEARGIRREKISNAENLLKLGVQPKIISKSTGLTTKELNKLRASNIN